MRWMFIYNTWSVILSFYSLRQLNNFSKWLIRNEEKTLARNLVDWEKNLKQHERSRWFYNSYFSWLFNFQHSRFFVDSLSLLMFVFMILVRLLLHRSSLSRFFFWSVFNIALLISCELLSLCHSFSFFSNNLEIFPCFVLV